MGIETHRGRKQCKPSFGAHFGIKKKSKNQSGINISRDHENAGINNKSKNIIFPNPGIKVKINLRVKKSGVFDFGPSQTCPSWTVLYNYVLVSHQSTLRQNGISMYRCTSPSTVLVCSEDAPHNQTQRMIIVCHRSSKGLDTCTQHGDPSLAQAEHTRHLCKTYPPGSLSPPNHPCRRV